MLKTGIGVAGTVPIVLSFYFTFKTVAYRSSPDFSSYWMGLKMSECDIFVGQWAV